MTVQSTAENRAPWAKDLTWREQLFVEEYVCDLNQKAAYQRAGLFQGENEHSIRSTANRMRHRPNVAAAIEVLMHERSQTRQWVIHEISESINFDIMDYATFDGENLKWRAWDELNADQRKMIAGVVPHPNPKTGVITYEIKFHNGRTASLDKLSKVLRMEVQRTEISGPDKGPIEVQSVERVNSILDQMAARAGIETEK